MKIRDILAEGRPSVSFEVFPPRKDAPFTPVKEAVERLAGERPSFISVTYGASGNAQANTAEVATFVQKCGVPALAHLTCLTATRESIARETEALRAAGRGGSVTLLANATAPSSLVTGRTIDENGHVLIVIEDFNGVIFRVR